MADQTEQTAEATESTGGPGSTEPILGVNDALVQGAYPTAPLIDLDPDEVAEAVASAADVFGD